MSQENVEIVRRFYQVLNEWLTSYWSDPEQPVNKSPGVEKVFEHLDPEAEWDWVFSPETFRGREQLLQAVADWLETVTDWRVEVEELIAASWHAARAAALRSISPCPWWSQCATARSPG